MTGTFTCLRSPDPSITRLHIGAYHDAEHHTFCGLSVTGWQEVETVQPSRVCSVCRKRYFKRVQKAANG